MCAQSDYASYFLLCLCRSGKYDLSSRPLQSVTREDVGVGRSPCDMLLAALPATDSTDGHGPRESTAASTRSQLFLVHCEMLELITVLVDQGVTDLRVPISGASMVG